MNGAPNVLVPNVDGVYRIGSNNLSGILNGGKFSVSGNDTRLLPTLGYNLAPGVVNAADADAGLTLQAFPNAIIDADIDAPQGWKFGTDGSATVVAVIDTGLDVNHPDITPNVWSSAGRGVVRAGVINGQSFAQTEKHDVTQSGFNAAGDPVTTGYISGEGVYLDVDNSGTVTVGDMRILPPRAPAGLAANVAVMPGDADLTIMVNGKPTPTPLENFQQILPTTFESRTGVNVNMVVGAPPPNGQYIYNDLAFLLRPAGAPNVVSVSDIRLTPVPGTPGANANPYVPTTVNAGDPDVTPVALVAFGANELHTGAAPYANGQSIYNNVSANGKVTVPPNILLSGPAQANGTPLTAFTAGVELHDTTAGGPAYTAGDGIYDDNDASRTVTAGDTRITPSTMYPVPAGAVGADDADVIPRLLHQFGATFRHTDPSASSVFVVGDYVYNHTAQVAGIPSGGVTPGDTRVTATFGGVAGSMVNPGDRDVGLPLSGFSFFLGVYERHAENVLADGRFETAEFIYNDADNSGTVTPGDVRLTPVPGTPGAAVVPYAPTFVMPGDPDVYAPIALQAFVNQEAHDVTLQAGDYLAGEGIYIDRDNSGDVSVGDTRITPAAGSGLPAGVAVAGPDADVGNKLTLFTADMRQKHDASAGAGVLGANTYAMGDGIYLDLDGSGTVSPGDNRLLPPANLAAGGLAPGTVMAGNADAPRFLVNFAADLQGTVLTDAAGHGTSVAGCIGAAGVNVNGVCWQAQLMGLKTSLTTGSIVNCINWIIGQRQNNAVPVKIVNESFGGPGLAPAMATAMNNAMNAGMLFTVAAGNDSNDNNPQGESQECVYQCRRNDGTLSVGDTRITGYGRPALGLGPGTVVAAGDEDFIAFTARAAFNVIFNANGLVPRPPYLHAFLPIEKYYDPANGAYAVGDIVYRDMDGNGHVSANDIRLGTFIQNGQFYSAGRVLATDPDAAFNGGAGYVLTPFGANTFYHDISEHIGNTSDHVANYYDGALSLFPASYNLPRQITVAASDNMDNLAGLSSWGTQNVHLAAPGQGVFTTMPVAQNPASPYRWINGTSFSAPLVAGILDHMWSLAAYRTAAPDTIKSWLLSDINGAVNNYASTSPHGIDHRIGIRNSVISGGANHDGRARLDSGDDFGDAPLSYPVTLPNWGARHEDLGEEWLGLDPTLPLLWIYNLLPWVPPPPATCSTPEYDAVNGAAWPPDPDGVQNVVDTDFADNGIQFIGPLVFSPPGGPPNQATVRVFVDTANNDVVDGASGRYAATSFNAPLGISNPTIGDGVHGAGDNRDLWVNAFFDWNQNGSFEDPGEQVFMLACNPTAFLPNHGAVYYVTFNMPVAPPNIQSNAQIWARFRLDYGEDAGQSFARGNPSLPHVVGPSPGGSVMFWDDKYGLPLPGPVAERYESVPVTAFAKPGAFGNPSLFLSRGVARYGEVEDYVVNVGTGGSNQLYPPDNPYPYPDQVHIYGPSSNSIPTNVVETLTAMVEKQFVGLAGETIVFSVPTGSIYFTSGETNNADTEASAQTDTNGAVTMQFFATEAGPALIQATVSATGQTAYLFLQVAATPALAVVPAAVSTRSISLQLSGTPGQNYDIQRSADLQNWTTIATVTAPPSGVIIFTDTTAPPDRAFYSATISP